MARTHLDLERLSRALSAALAEPALRHRIAEEAAMQFDADTEALYSSLANRILPTGVSAHALIRRYALAAGFASTDAALE